MRSIFILLLFMFSAAADDFNARVCRVYSLDSYYLGQFYFEKDLDQFPNQTTVSASRVTLGEADEVKQVKMGGDLIKDYKYYRYVLHGRTWGGSYEAQDFTMLSGASLIMGSYDSIFTSQFWRTGMFWGSYITDTERREIRDELIREIGVSRISDGYLLRVGVSAAGSSGTFFPMWVEPGSGNKEACHKVKSVLGSTMTDALVWMGRNKVRQIFAPDTDR